jgi:signal transduction histidine kinase
MPVLYYICYMDSNIRKTGSNTAENQSSGSGITSDKISHQIKAYQKQLRRLASELSLAEARGRREIASDLHDHIGQALAYVNQKVSTLQGNAIFSGMEDEFSEILSILDQTIRYTRDLTVAISPPVLYELGLAAAIDWLAGRAQQRHKLKVKSSQSGTAPEISEAIKVFLFKAVQELLTNISKHAQANRVNIETNWLQDGVEIIVSDDGCGFDPASFANGLSADCCFGLFSIRERLSYIGGLLNIDSSPGKGTRVTISAPYKIAGGAEYD